VETWKNPNTIAAGIACQYPYDVEVALPALYKCNGVAETVTDHEILEAERLLAKTEGVFAEPSAASSIAGLRKLIDGGTIGSDDLVVCELTGSGLKDTKVATPEPNDPIAPTLEELESALQLYG
jgi:threonine synthase